MVRRPEISLLTFSGMRGAAGSFTKHFGRGQCVQAFSAAQICMRTQLQRKFGSRRPFALGGTCITGNLTITPAAIAVCSLKDHESRSALFSLAKCVCSGCVLWPRARTDDEGCSPYLVVLFGYSVSRCNMEAIISLLASLALITAAAASAPWKT